MFDMFDQTNMMMPQQPGTQQGVQNFPKQPSNNNQATPAPSSKPKKVNREETDSTGEVLKNKGKSEDPICIE